MTRAEAVDSPDELAADSRQRAPWRFPNCPECEGHLFVGTSCGNDDWHCHRCGVHWTIERRE